jgi:hypothetical protein
MKRGDGRQESDMASGEIETSGRTGWLRRPGEKALRRTAWIIWVVCVALSVVWLALHLANLSLLKASFGPIMFPGPYAALAVALGYGTVALLIITHRPEHAMGWLFLALALAGGLSLVTQGYALFSFLRPVSEPLPGTTLAAWATQWLQLLIYPAGIALPYLLFPDGRLPSRRWRQVARLAAALIILGVLAVMTEPGPMFVHVTNEAIQLPVMNPVGVELGVVRDVLSLAWPLALFTLVAAMLAPISRYRRASGVQRQQLKWFVYFGILTILFFPLAFLAEEIAGATFIAMTVLILPVATAVAILRYHLYDIDVIIRKTAVYTILSAVLASIYLSVVILLQSVVETISGRQSPIAIVISTLVIAALFAPLRRRVQDFIDRRFYRRKYDAQKTLSAFAHFVRDETDLATLRAELLRVTEETMQPEQVSIWLKTGDRVESGRALEGTKLTAG